VPDLHRPTGSRARRRIDVIVATTPYVAGHRVVETKGEVFGLVVRSLGFGRSAGLAAG
jgi:hypothetical protein